MSSKKPKCSECGNKYEDRKLPTAWAKLIARALRYVQRGDRLESFAMCIVTPKRLIELGYIEGGGYIYVNSKKVYPDDY